MNFSKVPTIIKAVLVIFVVETTSICAVETVSETRPHIIFILADDAGWNDFSFHGSAQIPTPNIDALAFSGTILNSYYGSPLCTPSRGAIFTGKYPIHLGLQHYVIRGDTADGLPLSEKLLPEYLKELGYSTHLVGKWHLGHAHKEFSPTFRGFDSHFGYWLGNQDYYDHTSTDAGHWGYDFRKDMDVDFQSFGVYNTDLFTGEAIRLIQSHPSDKPMFLMVAHTAPHSGNEYDPLQAPAENIAKFQDSILDANRRVYAAMVDKLDESVGSIVTELSRNNMVNNSIIIFASDNGAAPEGLDLNYGSNWPLRGVKNTLWEGGTRLPACIWSSNIRNQVSTEMMHSSDWLMTLIEAAGGNVTELNEIDGVSLWKTLTSGEPSPRRQLLYNIDGVYNNSAVRYAQWKLIQGNTSTNDLGGGVWDEWYGFYESNATVNELIPTILASKVALALANIGFSLKPEVVENLQYSAKVQCNNDVQQGISCNAYEAPCLFNLEDDPCELNNLAEEQNEIVQQLLGLIKAYNETAIDIIDLSHHPEAAPRNWGYIWTNWKDYMNEN